MGFAVQVSKDVRKRRYSYRRPRSWGKDPAFYDYPCLNSFAQAKHLYESITPIRGKRKAIDVRPISYRKDHLAQIHKISDSEYSVVYTSFNTPWKFRKFAGDKEDRYTRTTQDPELVIQAKRGISYMEDGRVIVRWPGCTNLQESLMPTKHNIRQREVELTRWSVGWRELNLWNQTLPEGVGIAWQERKAYVVVGAEGEEQFYWLPKEGELVLRKKKKGWVVENPEQEIKQSLGVELPRIMRERLAEFRKYARVYWDMVTAIEPDKQWPRIDNTVPAAYLALELDDQAKFDLLIHIKSNSWDWKRPDGAGWQDREIVYREMEAALKLWQPRIRREFYKAHRDRCRHTPWPIGKVCPRDRY